MNLVLNSTVGPVDDEPTTFEEAVSGPNATMWIETMNEEIESLRVNETWSLAPLPKETNCIKWIYKLKERMPNTQKPRYKARLVAKGYS